MVDKQEIGNTKSRNSRIEQVKAWEIKRLDRDMYAEFGNHLQRRLQWQSTLNGRQTRRKDWITVSQNWNAIVSRITPTIPSQHIECRKWLCYKMGVGRAIDFTGLQQIRQIITQDKSFYDFEDCSWLNFHWITQKMFYFHILKKDSDRLLASERVKIQTPLDQQPSYNRLDAELRMMMITMIVIKMMIMQLQVQVDCHIMIITLTSVTMTKVVKAMF